MRFSAEYWISKLQLIRHVEGGSYKEIYRSPLVIDKSQLPESFANSRHISTSIYFLLEKNQFSAFHRIQSDELWHFYTGDSLSIFEISDNGTITEHKLGNNPEKGEYFQCMIKAGNWFASAVNEGGEYSLAGCTVSPGFDFEDFELGERTTLITMFPQHTELITRLTY